MDEYQDFDGNPCSLHSLCVAEPEWAVNHIERLTADNAKLLAVVEALRQERRATVDVARAALAALDQTRLDQAGVASKPERLPPQAFDAEGVEDPHSAPERQKRTIGHGACSLDAEQAEKGFHEWLNPDDAGQEK